MSKCAQIKTIQVQGLLLPHINDRNRLSLSWLKVEGVYEHHAPQKCTPQNPESSGCTYYYIVQKKKLVINWFGSTVTQQPLQKFHFIHVMKSAAATSGWVWQCKFLFCCMTNQHHPNNNTSSQGLAFDSC